jgi:hypothetical protein
MPALRPVPLGLARGNGVGVWAAVADYVSWTGRHPAAGGLFSQGFGNKPKGRGAAARLPGGCRVVCGASGRKETEGMGLELADAAAFRRIARRVEDILEAARDRERRGQSLALDIDARFHLRDMGAVQFQLASAILEEMEGYDQEQVVSELLSLGLAAVLDGAARVAGGVTPPRDELDDTRSERAQPLLVAGSHAVN